MKTARSVGWLFLAIVSALTCHGAEPVPFWELPKSTVGLNSLTPAEVKLVAAPDTQRGMILLQTGEEVPVADFVPTRADLKVLVPEMDGGYAIVQNGLANGITPFGDRKYKLSKVPKAFEGLTLLQTKMGHKAIVDATYAITVSTPKPCLVFLALDDRVIDIYKQHGTPGWLSEYEPTGETIKTDEPVMAETDAAYQVFVRKSGGGRIVLGPPGMDIRFNSMYFAFFGEAKP
ncbi:MAG TPA: hypothetical protein VGI40_25255 [Pirellulaceae bacterium]|jgi:hypothetical protein